MSLSQSSLNPTFHEGFVELEELICLEDTLVWKEKARWIKLEEDVEECANRWGKPHIPCLTFHSLKGLRRTLENAVILLDLHQSDLPSLFEAVVNEMIVQEKLREEEREAFMAVLLTRHRHQNQKKLPSMNRVKGFTRRVSRINPSQSGTASQGHLSAKQGNLLNITKLEDAPETKDTAKQT